MPEPLEIVVKDRPDEAVGFACSSCGIMFTTRMFGSGPGSKDTARQSALFHCAPKECACGKAIDRKYWTICTECSDRKEAEKLHDRFEKAAKVSVEDYDGPIYWPDGPSGSMGEGFYTSLDEMLDVYEAEGMDLPPYVWAAKSYELKMDASSLLENALEQHHEDAHEHLEAGAEEELQTLLDFFCQKQKIKSWEVDFSRVVLLTSND